MFDFVNDRTQDKGLFTFYRQQAQIEQKITSQKKKSKETMKNFTQKQMTKLKNRYDNGTTLENRKSSKTNLSMTQKFAPKKSFDQLNKDFIRKLSVKNQLSLNLTCQQSGSEVVVIRKANSFKQKPDLKLQKLNQRYQMKDGHFIKQKVFDPLQQGLLNTGQNFQISSQILTNSIGNQNSIRSEKTIQQLLSRKKRMKRNQSLNDKYHTSKVDLQNQLIISEEIKEKPEGAGTSKLQSIKRVDLQSSFSQLQNQATVIQTSRNHHYVHKRIPPKVLASILKNENHELIKQLRKELEKQKEEQTKNIIMSKNHSFIEYGSQDFFTSGLDAGRLNQKQRRLVTILNKFNKNPFTKVFIN